MMNCTNCGSFISDRESFCPQCGAKVPHQQQTDALVCPVCETKNPIGTTRCTICGVELTQNNNSQNYTKQNNQKTEKTFCMHCGAQNTVTSTFCLNCGKSLKGESASYASPEPKRVKPEKSYTPIIIALIITAVISVVAALLIIFSDELFVTGGNTGDSEGSKNTTETDNRSQKKSDKNVRFSTAEPTQRPDRKPTPTPTVEPTAEPSSEYTYYTYENYDYAFSCPYPASMYEVSRSSSPEDFIRCTFESTDEAILYICGTTNDPVRSASTIAQKFKEPHTGYTTEFEYIESDYCSVLISDGYNYRYCYYNLSDGMIRGFEMEYTEPYCDKYADYADYMRANIEL